MPRNITNLSRRLGGLLVALLIIGPEVTANDTGIRPEFALLNEAPTLEEPIVLVFTLPNGTSDQIVFSLGIENLEAFSFVLRAPGGGVSRGRYQPPEFFSSAARPITVHPGGEFREEILLNRWLQFRDPGRYTLTVSVDTKIRSNSLDGVVPEPQEIHFLVRPKNPERLRAVCEDLANRVASSKDWEGAHRAALQLSFISDPIAVPFLAKVIFARKIVHDVAIAALEKIGTDDARRVLLSASNDGFSDVSVLAKRALRNILPGTVDPKLKKVIQQALEGSS